MVLGALLRRLREARGISCQEAGAAIRASESRINHLESGRTGFRLRDVIDLCGLYGVTDQIERATLLGLARQANAPGWWHAFGDVMPAWFAQYVGLEQAASVIRRYEDQFVPDLLQTPDYARAVIMLGRGNAPRQEIERGVELRMRRQRILLRTRPPHLWVVIDEAALRRCVGAAATMFAQLEYLIDVCDLAHITIHVLPSHTECQAVAGGPITLLRLSEPEVPDVVYPAQTACALCPGSPVNLACCLRVLNRLAIQAEPAAATPGILRRIIKDL